MKVKQGKKNPKPRKAPMTYKAAGANVKESRIDRRYPKGKRTG